MNKKTVIYKEEEVPLQLLTMGEKYKLDKSSQTRAGNYLCGGYMDRTYNIDRKFEKLRNKIARENGFGSYAEFWNAYLQELKFHGKVTDGEIAKVIRQIGQETHSLKEADSNLKKEWTAFQEKNRQLYLRDAMAILRKRANRTDINGNPVLSPEEWVKALSKCGSEEERSQICKELHTLAVNPTTGGRMWVDTNIQPFLQRLMLMGYEVYGHSGTVSDHPGLRYAEKDEETGVGPGEPVCWGTVNNVSYLFFGYPTDAPDDMRQKMDTALQAADKTGWCVEKMPDGCFQISLPLCMDGTGDFEIEEELQAEAQEGESVGSRQQLIDRHGGRVWFTDEMKIARFREFTAAVEQKMKYRVMQGGEPTSVHWVHIPTSGQQVSDITVTAHPDGRLSVRCKVYGEQQTDRMMTGEDRALFLQRISSSDKAWNGLGPELAKRYFKNEIQEMQDEFEYNEIHSRGFRRR